MSYDLQRAQAYFADRIAFTTGLHELDLLRAGTGSPRHQIVDVRAPADYAAGHVPGAINLPKGQWRRAPGLDRDATQYVYCYNATCHLAAEAALELTRQGFRVVEVEGGWDGWTRNGYAVEAIAKSA
jgi:rhodanese-related sulfurtransferase